MQNALHVVPIEDTRWWVWSNGDDVTMQSPVVHVRAPIYARNMQIIPKFTESMNLVLILKSPSYQRDNVVYRESKLTGPMLQNPTSNTLTESSRDEQRRMPMDGWNLVTGVVRPVKSWNAD